LRIAAILQANEPIVRGCVGDKAIALGDPSALRIRKGFRAPYDAIFQGRIQGERLSFLAIRLKRRVLS
jgi:hypothetical protein